MGARKIAREGTKLLAGLIVSAGAGAVAMGGLSLIPRAAITGLGRIFAGAGTMGIGAWVSDKAAEAVEKRVDTAWNVVDFLADGKKVFDDPRVKELMSIMKEMKSGEISPEEAQERLDNLKMDNDEEFSKVVEEECKKEREMMEKLKENQKELNKQMEELSKKVD